jgi:hypothetical protein
MIPDAAGTQTTNGLSEGMGMTEKRLAGIATPRSGKCRQAFQLDKEGIRL